jgi:hydroxyethylthiazole kinase-like uncharacterized protein yjeF
MITSQGMKKLEANAIQAGISVLELMENAGKAVSNVIKEKFTLDDKNVIIFCGSGNNGGDGFVAARHLAKVCSVIVLFFGYKEKLSEEAREHYRKIDGKINIIEINKEEDLKTFHFQEDLDFILVDALLGTGIDRKIYDPISLGIDLFNSLKGFKVAVDLPSGINPDTGSIADKSCDADLVVCFHELKHGLEKLKEKTVVVGIGIPKSVSG